MKQLITRNVFHCFDPAKGPSPAEKKFNLFELANLLYIFSNI